MKIIWERNSLIHFSLIIFSVALGSLFSPFCFLLWIAVLFIDDLCYYWFGLSLFDPEIRIQRCYQFANIFLTKPAGEWRDYSENFYDGDLSKTRKQAQTDKWEFYLKQLQLSPGDSLIDIGCGYGDWLNFAKSKGIHVTGVNITPEQADYARREYGIDVLCTNWKEILCDEEKQKKLYGKYDAVTFLGCIEHFVPCRYRFDIQAQNRVYADMFKFAYHLLKNKSKSNRIFLSCLHQTRNLESFREAWFAYLNEKFHSGFYPFGDDGLTKNYLPYFTELHRFDRTEDFRITSVLDPYHFGAPKIDWTMKKFFSSLFLFFLDPCHIHRWIYYAFDGWMQFHFGNKAWNPKYQMNPNDRRLVKQWWIVLEKNPLERIQ